MSHQRPVYVIDPDLSSRRSLAALLTAMGAEAWPFGEGAEFLQILDHLLPACILLDVDASDLRGGDVMAELARRGCDWPVVAMSGRPDVATAVEAMKRGALDFLPKPVGQKALAAAMAPAWDSLSRSIETSEVRRTAQERVARLTSREIDISKALFTGQPNKAVAHQLGISVRTVEMHRAHIMAKLGVKNLAEAAVLAAQAGLVLASPGLPCASPVSPRVAAIGQRKAAALAQTLLPRRLPLRSAH